MAFRQDQLHQLVGQLYEDLNDTIAKQAWGGGGMYVRLCNPYLAQVKSLASELDLDEPRGPIIMMLDENRPDRLAEAGFQADQRETLLRLKPLVGQLYRFLKGRSDGLQVAGLSSEAMEPVVSRPQLIPRRPEDMRMPIPAEDSSVARG